MLGLILAAGRGSRLGGLTAESPKCLVPLGGRPLIDYQTASLKAAGVDEVVAVTGYRSGMIEALGVRTVHNPLWERTNMVASLLCARNLVTGPAIVSYSDIVYSPAAVESLMGADDPLALTYDPDWLRLWSRRFGDPSEDAESFRIDPDGLITEIGKKGAPLEEISGQYMGLLRFTPESMEWLAEAAGEAGPGLDMTGALSLLIKKGKPVRGVVVKGGWCEVDDEADLAVAEELLKEGALGMAPPAGAGWR